MTRRRFLKRLGAYSLAAACGSAFAASLSPEVTQARTATHRIRAVAFDLFTIFDPRGVDQRVADVLGPNTELARTWKTRLFEYCWIRAASHQYRRFDQLVSDSLEYAANTQGIALTSTSRAKLESVFTELTPWPDAQQVLQGLAERGFRLAPLANYAPSMIEALLANNGMRGLFEAVASTDRARTYKPDPRAYALAERTFGLPRQHIAFAAFGGWDAAGARWYGMPTFWVNRLGVKQELLTTPDATGANLEQLAAWVQAG